MLINLWVKDKRDGTQLYLNRELVHKDLIEMLKGDFNNAD